MEAMRASPPTFHGFSRLDELRDGASHSLGVAGQLLLQVVAGLLQDLRKGGGGVMLHPWGQPEPTAGSCCLGGAGGKGSSGDEREQGAGRGWNGREVWGCPEGLEKPAGGLQVPFPWGFPNSQGRGFLCLWAAWPGREMGRDEG